MGLNSRRSLGRKRQLVGGTVGERRKIEVRNISIHTAKGHYDLQLIGENRGRGAIVRLRSPDGKTQLMTFAEFKRRHPRLLRLGREIARS